MSGARIDHGRPRLTVLLGAGGVGKTTLAAAYSLALARSGRRVGLLGIDPSRRLKSALGVDLSDRETPLRDAPECKAAILEPKECLRRWAADGLPDGASRERLFANPFFLALADRLATATDVLAAIRIAEWAEHDPTLTDLVVDTAPGINAIEFLRRPRHLAELLDGDLVRWLRRGASHASTRLLLSSLRAFGGARLFADLAELFTLIEEPVERMLARVGEARRFVEADAQLLLVTAVRDDAAVTATAIRDALGELGLRTTATIVNRTLPAALEEALAQTDIERLSPSAAVLLRYARVQAATQARVEAAARACEKNVVLVPTMRRLERRDRLDGLAAVGEELCASLRAVSPDSLRPRSARRAG